MAQKEIVYDDDDSSSDEELEVFKQKMAASKALVAEEDGSCLDSEEGDRTSESDSDESLVECDSKGIKEKAKALKKALNSLAPMPKDNSDEEESSDGSEVEENEPKDSDSSLEEEEEEETDEEEDQEPLTVQTEKRGKDKKSLSTKGREATVDERVRD